MIRLFNLAATAATLVTVAGSSFSAVAAVMPKKNIVAIVGAAGEFTT